MEEIGDLPRALAETLFGVSHRIKLQVSRSAAVHDLSMAQVRVLYALDQPLPMGELAERLYLDPSNLTAVVDRLEALGLVERQIGVDDRRVKRIIVTAQGVSLCDEITNSLFAEASVFDALDLGEQRTLFRLLSKLLEAPPSAL